MILSTLIKTFRNLKHITDRARRWCTGLERSPRMRKAGCSNPSRDILLKVVKTGSDSSTAKHSALGVSVSGPRR